MDFFEICFSLPLDLSALHFHWKVYPLLICDGREKWLLSMESPTVFELKDIFF